MLEFCSILHVFNIKNYLFSTYLEMFNLIITLCYLTNNNVLLVNQSVQKTFRIRHHQCCDVTTELDLKPMTGQIHYLEESSLSGHHQDV